MSDMEFATEALEKAQVQVIPGSLMKAVKVSFASVMPPRWKTSTKVCAAASGSNHAAERASMASRTYRTPVITSPTMMPFWMSSLFHFSSHMRPI